MNGNPNSDIVLAEKMLFYLLYDFASLMNILLVQRILVLNLKQLVKLRCMYSAPQEFESFISNYNTSIGIGV